MELLQDRANQVLDYQVLACQNYHLVRGIAVHLFLIHELVVSNSSSYSLPTTNYGKSFLHFSFLSMVSTNEEQLILLQNNVFESTAHLAQIAYVLDDLLF